LTDLHHLSPLDPSLYRGRKAMPDDGDPREIVYESSNHIPGLSWGVAYADVLESARHMHHRTRETYVHLEGPPLLVQVGDAWRRLEPGDSVTIPPETPHMARSDGPGMARILVTTHPAWQAEDHIGVE
jgi:mannose-6-phosphate isomerase-like protein (cupin superfamily)